MRAIKTKMSNMPCEHFKEFRRYVRTPVISKANPAINPSTCTCIQYTDVQISTETLKTKVVHIATTNPTNKQFAVKLTYQVQKSLLGTPRVPS
jgi:hypothetical protein